MCKLIIKNVGPIRNVEMDVKKITMVIGPQSSGKSTIGKILCHCQWIEKRCYINPKEEIPSKANSFQSVIEDYYRLTGYFQDNSYILYEGTFITLEFKDGKCEIRQMDETKAYVYPKLSYIPAERNLAAVIPNIKKYNEKNDHILYFIYDWTTAREYVHNADLGNLLEHNISYSYSNSEDIINDNGHTLQLRNASSGLQSLLPLYVVCTYILDKLYTRIRPLSAEELEQASSLSKDLERLGGLVEIAKKHQEMTEPIKEEWKSIIDKLSGNPLLQNMHFDLDGLSESINREFFYKGTHIYLEEMEQNLFPNSQETLLYWVVSRILESKYDHTAYLTTHSPYVLFALNNCLMGYLVKDAVPGDEKKCMLSQHSWIDPQEVAIYEIHDGSLKSIQDEDGTLEQNYLNLAYKRNSNEFVTMLNYYNG